MALSASDMTTLKIHRKRGTILIDDADFHRLDGDGWRFTVNTNRTVISRKSVGGVRVVAVAARLITGAGHGLEVDHINGDPTDNRRLNLRVCTKAQNQCNRKAWGRSKFLGVHYDKGRGWVASGSVNGIKRRIGCFQEEWEAADAYNALAVVNHGEYARLNKRTI